jgi:hypothetical protein
MNLLQVRAELENERTWRKEEVRFLLNRLGDRGSEDEKDRYRRAVVLLLYAHFEGFCKTALLIFVKAVNDERLPCDSVKPALMSATCNEILLALADHNQKSDFFRTGAPEDAKLHFAWRSQTFLARLPDVLKKEVAIPDKVVDTESNLWPVVLKKNLFKLGLDYDAFSHHDGTITQLLNRRNNIAHGLDRDGMDAMKFSDLQRAVYDVIDSLLSMVMKALREKAYLTAATQPKSLEAVA